MAIPLIDNIVIILMFSNILILVYAVIYAWRFISLTQADNARKPWEYLMGAIIILLVLNVYTFLNLNLNKLITPILTFSLTTLLLLVFIIQDFHMKKSNYETLTRKEMISVKERIEEQEK